MTGGPPDPRQGWLLGQPTLAEVVHWYLTQVVDPSPKAGTKKTYTWTLNWWVGQLSPHPSAAEVIELGAALVEAGKVTRGTFNMRRRILGRCLKMSQTRWRLLDNIIVHVPQLVEVATTPRALSRPLETFPTLVAAMPDARARAFIEVQRWMGLRVGEARGIEPKDLNLVDGTLLIARQRPIDSSAPTPLKSDTSKATVPIPPEVIGHLREAARDTMRAGVPRGEARRRFMFPYYRLDQDALLADLRRVAPEEFNKRVVGQNGGDAWHVFRHTYGQMLVEAFRDDWETIRSYMRHKHLATTQRYCQSWRGQLLKPDPLRDLWAKLAGARPAPDIQPVQEIRAGRAGDGVGREETAGGRAP